MPSPVSWHDRPMAEGSPRGHGKEAHGGKPVGRRVALPRGAARPIAVYINGQVQKEGLDYTLHEGHVIFKEPILKEDLSELPLLRKIVLGLGLVGSYQRNETVDAEYHLSGQKQFASDLRVIPER
jgi:hypothetical protein